jgi:hypothetical protein
METDELEICTENHRRPAGVRVGRSRAERTGAARAGR